MDYIIEYEMGPFRIYEDSKKTIMTKKYKLLRNYYELRRDTVIEFKCKIDGHLKYTNNEGFDYFIKEGLVLNKNVFEEIKEKTWEIVSMKSPDGKPHDILFDCDNICKIHSVKRLSDGEVFTVGNFFTHKTTTNWRERHAYEISSFKIENDEMKVVCDNVNGGSFLLDNIAKHGNSFTGGETVIFDKNKKVGFSKSENNDCYFTNVEPPLEGIRFIVLESENKKLKERILTLEKINKDLVDSSLSLVEGLVKENKELIAENKKLKDKENTKSKYAFSLYCRNHY